MRATANSNDTVRAECTGRAHGALLQTSSTTVGARHARDRKLQ